MDTDSAAFFALYNIWYYGEIMKTVFHKRKRDDHPWKNSPVLELAREPVAGGTHRLGEKSKLWEVADVTWCFEPGPVNVFSHFSCGVV